jgi:cytochrome c oxidase subunit 4
VYLTVFAALGVLTVVTVALSYLQLSTAYAITVAMVVATVKAGLVASYFMHLITEERVIHWILALTIAFFVTLMLIPVVTETGNGPLWAG